MAMSTTKQAGPQRFSRGTKALAALTATLGAIVGVSVATAPSSAVGTEPQSVTAFEVTEIATWAEQRGLSGLSPASVAGRVQNQPTVFDLSGVADWAQVNGLSGLSPASVTPN
jgi:hypothetical protein